jgi:hypothetical protein
MQLDLLILFGIHVHRCTHWMRPRNSPLPPHVGSYTRALLISQDRRHLFVNPWVNDQRFVTESIKMKMNSEFALQTFQNRKSCENSFIVKLGFNPTLTSVANCFKYTICFFFIWNFKILKLLAFLSHRDYMSRTHTFEKRQCDRCQHRSAVKNTPFPSLSLPVPIPPPQHQLTRANGIGPFGSCDLLGQWRAVPGAKHRNPFRSAPLPPSCPVPAKPALPVEKKVSHSQKG